VKWIQISLNPIHYLFESNEKEGRFNDPLRENKTFELPLSLKEKGQSDEGPKSRY